MRHYYQDCVFMENFSSFFIDFFMANLLEKNNPQQIFIVRSLFRTDFPQKPRM